MKAVPKVNTDGLYIEDTLVDDAFSGVVPFYADPPETETDIEAAVDEEEEETEPEIAGYIVGVPVPQGLYLPQFDLAAWEAREEGEQTDPSGYWSEGLSAEEIEELTKPQPQEPTATDLLGEELTAMKLQNIQQQALVGSMGEQLVQSKLEGIQQQQTIGALGAELAATKLEVIKLKGADQA
ncbi:hypothetical protein [Paenibacillus aceti]|uniref:Bacteriophage SP-beta YorD domain-containing protein n=1 Tax=Paenibacillus aceti TaxID=1820010 RepID=A0ABQ1VPU0_9BACL|nr:hypothetical protein [Paenibacillus aceti]GGF86961.1 hypothetical protein GCM10010913_05550 [Paenibacillus aceti]